MELVFNTKIWHIITIFLFEKISILAILQHIFMFFILLKCEYSALSCYKVWALLTQHHLDRTLYITFCPCHRQCNCNKMLCPKGAKLIVVGGGMTCPFLASHCMMQLLACNHLYLPTSLYQHSPVSSPALPYFPTAPYLTEFPLTVFLQFPISLLP